MDKDYWNKYYKTISLEEEPSTFARFCSNKYLNKNSIILETGCGNGRDSFYFAEKGYKIYAFDQSEYIINLLNNKNTFENLEFFAEDILDLEKHPNINCIYSRFVFHSLNIEEESKMIKYAYNVLPLGGLFLIEARSIKSSLYGEGKQIEKDTYFYNNHSRRFIEKNQLIDKLQKYGFKIIEVVEEEGLAIHNNDNPVVVRIAIKKVKNK
jgi:cyclopropane fatty-acyl-phospholipid synthase-like methyltransferase